MSWNVGKQDVCGMCVIGFSWWLVVGGVGTDLERSGCDRVAGQVQVHRVDWYGGFLAAVFWFLRAGLDGVVGRLYT